MSLTKKEEIILILAKSPVPLKGRFGPRQIQDWFCSLYLGVLLSKENPNSKILITSKFETPDGGKEINAYEETLKKDFGITNAILLQEGSETVGQLVAGLEYATKNDASLMIVSTLLHAPRVVYLCWKDKIKADISISFFGLPRPKEATTDIILTFIFPIIDLLGKRAWFLEKLSNRRNSGKL